jgi:predicted transcriptional regulator
MKTKMTIRLETDLLRKIRELAAEEGTTIGAMIAAHLRQLVGERQAYRQARKRAMARLRRGMNLGWVPSGSRHEVHQR